MKKVLKNNKKGFTLIELLAVIVILAILVMVAIPAVTKYLTESRKGTFSDNALTAISAVRNDVILNGSQKNVYYDLESINTLLEKKLKTSPFGNQFNADSYIKVEYTMNGSEYKICLSDGSFGIDETAEGEVDKDDVKQNVTCTRPANDSGFEEVDYGTAAGGGTGA